MNNNNVNVKRKQQMKLYNEKNKRRKLKEKEEKKRKKKNSIKMQTSRSKERKKTKDIQIIEISKTIELKKSMDEAVSYLKRTNKCHNENSNIHSANICVVCDRFITGVMDIFWIKKSDLKRNSTKLSVTSCETKCKIKIPSMLRNQYRCIDEDDTLNDLLLSRRAKKSEKGYMICQSCKNSLIDNKNVKGPPRFAIANGFVIGHIPPNVMTESDITELVSAMIAPVRPFSYAMSFSGGALKTLKGHHTFFESNVTHMGSVMNNYLKTGANPNVYCIMCGRFTPKQREQAKLKSLLDANKFMNLLDWFIDHSNHSDFKDLEKPENCPQPVLIQDEIDSNNTDDELNPSKENIYEGARYYFPSANEPTDDTGVFKSQEAFATAMLKGTTPTILFHGGNFATNSHNIPLHTMFPIQFPFGFGGLDMKRPTRVSHEECIKHYMNLSLPQFHRQDFILVLLGIYNRIKSYQTGIIQCKSKMVDGNSFAEAVSKLTSDDICRAVRRRDNGMNDGYNTVASRFLNSVSTSCRPVGHSNEAAKYARRQFFSLWDRFGAPSLFFTITPDDECSFRVQFYANGGAKV